MAKKDKKYDAPQSTTEQPATEQPATEQPATEQPAATPTPKQAVYFIASVADAHGRVNYRFGKDKMFPKKAEGVKIMVDDTEAEMRITSSGGWANEATKGYNGWFNFEHPTHGKLCGWILFGHGVNPRELEGLSFKTALGTCEANPKREPINPEGELKRLENAKTARALKALASGTPPTEQPEQPAPEGGDTPPTEQPAPVEQPAA